MARHEGRGENGRGENRSPEEAAPDELSGLGKSSWAGVFKRTAKEFNDDDLTDWAAALTYYAVLSLFPALLAVVSLIGLFGEVAIQPLVDGLGRLAPAAVQEVLAGALANLQNGAGVGIAFAAGLAVALWSASGYVAAFMRAANVVYDMPEGRPFWISLPVRVGVTAVVVLLLALSAVAVVFTGDVAAVAADLAGLGGAAVQVWDIAKWPVIVLIVVLVLALLYWAAPNVRQPGFRWITAGSALAVLVWLAASSLFALYVANFGAYNETYGTLAGAVIFLVWLWITNIAVLFGVEFDAELQRERNIKAGRPPEEEPYAAPRSTRKFKEGEVPSPRGDTAAEDPRRHGTGR